jgi:hypothetical protein
MNLFIQNLSTISLLLLTLFLTGCATKPLQAPCDANATFCGTKTKINTW